MLQISVQELEDVTAIIERDFDGLYSGALGISSIHGGQTAANQALKNLDITGYASMRSQVFPKEDRGASGDLVRHGGGAELEGHSVQHPEHRQRVVTQVDTM